MPSEITFIDQLIGRKPGAIPAEGQGVADTGQLRAAPRPEATGERAVSGRFWSLDERKSFSQATLIVLFYLAVTSGMDAIVFMPFKDNPEARDLLALAMKFSPSLLVGVALTTLVAAGRGISTLIKITAVLAAAGAGYEWGSPLAFLVFFAVLLLPVREVDMGEESSREDNVFLLPPEFGVEPDNGVDPIDEFLKKKF